MARLFCSAAYRSFTFQKPKGPIGVINSLNVCGMEARNIAKFFYARCELDPRVSDSARHLRMLQLQNSLHVNLNPFLLIIARRHQTPTERSVRT
jgi:hypothetical protein